MAVPKKKTSHSVKGMRRSHHAIKFTAAVEYCPNCGTAKLRHHLCQACGQYRGRQVALAKVEFEAQAPTE
jgi:large subunit ribosomal protein L32